MSHIAREAYAYWHAAQRLRLSAREGQVDFPALDDMEVILMYSKNPPIIRDGERLTADVLALVAA